MATMDLEYLKAKLIMQRREIFSRLQNLDEGWQELSQRDIEMEEEAQKAELSEIFNQLDLQEQREIEEIDLALSRMDTGIYGICEGCRKNIPPERLQALPATPYCVKCSDKYRET
ncbi:MAG: TraR/DksA C4-type zinc finger protein [Desulfobulbaceae bacterium]|nr:TraR/DksA C4-type zinc finger protein [Desulfobulbaceae bacterium]